MKLTRFLLIAGAAVAAGVLLARTDKGRELRRNIAASSEKLGRKLKTLRGEPQGLLDRIPGYTKMRRKVSEMV